MTDDHDDTIDQYVPAVSRRVKASASIPAGSPVQVDTNGGIIVHASIGSGGATAQGALEEPTRYALSLRRQASNRARVAGGQQPLPMLGPGNCVKCDGWGVLGKTRQRCPVCHGRGVRDDGER